MVRKNTTDTFRSFRGVLGLFFLLVIVLVTSQLVQDHQADARLVLRYIGSIALLAAVGMVSLAAGLAFVGRGRDILTLSLAFLVGYGAWGMLVFLTGVFHGLYRSVLLAELLCLGIIFRRALNELLSLIPQFGYRLREASRITQLGVIVVGVYAAFLLIVSLGPVTAWDALESHWAIAKFFARHHAVPFPDFNGNGGTPQLVRMMFTGFCVFGFDQQASHAVWMFIPAMFGLTYGVARRFSSSDAALALTLAMFGVMVVYPQFSTQPVLDVPAFVFGLGAIVAALVPVLYESEREPEAIIPAATWPRYLALSGMLAGSALGTKWHVLAILPVLLVCFLVLWRPVLPGRSRARTAGWSMAAAFFPLAVFAVYDLVYTGHPFWHPLIPVPGNPDYWSGVAANVFLVKENVQVYRTRLCPSPIYNLGASVRWIVSNHALILPGLLVAPFALLETHRLRRRTVWILLSGGALCFLTPLILLYAHFRHTMLGVGILLLLVPLGWEALRRRKRRWVMMAVPVLILVGLASRFYGGRTPQIFGLYAPALRSVLSGSYFDDGFRVTYRYAATRWANAHLPEDAKVVADTRRLGNLDRDWMTIFPATQCVIGLSPDMSDDSLRDALLRRGTTHLWVDQHQDEDTIGYPSISGYLTSWRKLVAHDNWLDLLYSDSLVRIYALRYQCSWQEKDATYSSQKSNTRRGQGAA